MRRFRLAYDVSVTAAKASLSRLIAHVAGGDSVVIRREGRPVARIIPYERAPEIAQPIAAEEVAPSELPPLTPEDDRDWFKPFEHDWDGT